MLPSLLGIGVFRTQDEGAGASAEVPDEAMGTASSPTPPPRDPYPFETPDPSGKNWLYELPEEVMRDVLLRLDLTSLTRCMRLSRYFNEFASQSAALNLRHTLLANSLHLNPYAVVANPDVPHQMPLSSAKILAHLRETLTRFRNVTPKGESRVKFREPSGSLYEYLEGVLLRTSRPAGGILSGRSRTLHVYDLRRVDEWEDTEEAIPEGDDNVFETNSDSPMEGDYKSEHTFDFDIMEVATDPTQDLLVIVSLTRLDEPGQTSQRYKMEFHLFTLSTFEPHPKAKHPVLEFPQPLYKPKVQLGFQICDDGLYVLSQRMSITGRNRHVQIPDHLTGWQWTTGRRHVDLEAPNTVTFESFVLLTPWSFIVPVSVARLHSSDIVEEIEDIRDLYWTNHLWLYAFPPFSAADDDEHFGATHVATLDVPPLENNIAMGVPPMFVSVRTDPPPRHAASPYPLHAPPAYLPDPESGVAIIDFGFNHRILQMHPDVNERIRFTLVLQKPILIKHLPDPMTPMLRRPPPARAVPVVPWEKLAPDARFFGPDRMPTNWVCFVYQNRYVSPYARVVGRLARDSEGEDEEEDDDMEDPEVVEIKLQVFDFDLRRTRKEKLDRARRLPADTEATDEALEGDVDGIELVLSETVVHEVPHILKEPVRTGKNFPYILVEKDTDSINPLIDGQRVLQLIDNKRRSNFFEDDSDEDDEDDEDEVQIMEF